MAVEQGYRALGHAPAADERRLVEPKLLGALLLLAELLVGALLFGPVDGMIIGGLGTFLYQVLFSGYGITATTPLWILPYIVCGLAVGAYAKRRDYSLSRAQLIFIMVVSELAITLLNTFALYVDSRLYGYYSAAFVFGTLAVRLAICVAKAVCFGVVLPVLLRPLRKLLRRA